MNKPDADFGPRQAQPIESAIAWAASQGWDGLNLNGGQRDPRAELIEAEAKDLARATARLFDSEEGRRVLEFIADQTIRRPVTVMGMPDGLNYACFREGQNAVLFMLMKMIALGREETPPQREGS